MAKSRHPRRGSMQYWPRKRAKKSLARVRSWAVVKTVKPLGFIGYKAGMTHAIIVDNRPKAATKNKKITLATTIVECPPMLVAGVSFYKNNRKITSIMAEKLAKELSAKIPLPKKTSKKFEDVTEFEDLRLLVHSQPKLVGVAKKPKLIEMALGGSRDEKVAYGKEVLGKEIKIEDVFEPGNQVDLHGITKGKGFQGTVKRYGVPIKQHKGEKIKRGIGNLGAWTPKRVDYRVPQPGKMGYHLRTEYNKLIIKVSDKGDEVTPKGGFTKYGLVRNPYCMIKGSVIGSPNRAVLLTQAIRANTKIHKEAPEVTYISQ